MTKLRPYIVQHGVEFEWKLFKNQLEADIISISITKSWLESSWKEYKALGNPENEAFDLFPQAFMHLVSKAPKFNDDDVLPETFKMDTSRLVSFYNSWQDITILATILIIFRQISGPKCQLDNILEAKKGLWILLNDSDSTMSHITIQMASLASKIRGFAMTVKEISELEVMVEKTLAPGSKLYELVQKRVGCHLENGISHLKIDLDLLTKHGLTSLKTEIEELIVKIVPVADMNRAVYGGLYATLMQEIKTKSAECCG
jgi:T-complex protein 11